MRPAVSFEQYAAQQLLQQREGLARAWVQRIGEELRVRPQPLLPGWELDDALSELLTYVADFVCAEQPRLLTGRERLTETLAALARLRRARGCDPQELIREFDLLAQVLDAACLEWLRSYPTQPDPDAVLRVTGRANRAPLLLAELCVGAFRKQEAEELSETAERMRAFADNLAHELKTPLAAAEGAALLLEEPGMSSNPQERRRCVGVIQRNLRRARKLVDDVRALALAETGSAGSSRLRPVGVVLGEVLAEVGDPIRQAGVELEVGEPIPNVPVDGSLLQIVLLNLIDNAAKYSDPAQPRSWIRIGFERDAENGGGWWGYVSDNGLGIPAEHQPRVFERFFRAHPERADGTGLGLAIVREAIRQLGAEVRFESRPGEGSTFRFRLPAPHDPPPAAG